MILGINLFWDIRGRRSEGKHGTALAVAGWHAHACRVLSGNYWNGTNNSSSACSKPRCSGAVAASLFYVVFFGMTAVCVVRAQNDPNACVRIWVKRKVPWRTFVSPRNASVGWCWERHALLLLASSSPAICPPPPGLLPATRRPSPRSSGRHTSSTSSLVGEAGSGATSSLNRTCAASPSSRRLGPLPPLSSLIASRQILLWHMALQLLFLLALILNVQTVSCLFPTRLIGQ